MKEYKDIPKNRTMSFSGDIIPDEPKRRDIGKSGNEFRNVYARAVVAQTVTVETPIGDADTVDGIHASASPTADYLLALDGSSQFPTSVYPGAVLIDGTRALTANWDAGSFKITAQQLESDVVTGTAPLVIASTTLVTNLNADQLDSYEASAFPRKAEDAAVSGDWTITGAWTISTNVTVDAGITIDGVDISDHSARHDPGGADALTTAAPGFTLSTSNAEGSAASFIRSDATIAIFDATVPTDVDAGDSAAAGSAGVAARRDHEHGVNTGTPNLTLSTSNSEGVAASMLRTDATIALFDVTNPTSIAFGSSPATGSAGVAARRDHGHGIVTSDDPGAAEYILATDASGHLTLVQLNTDTISDKSGSDLTISPTGDVIFNPGGDDILPANAYDLNIGSINKKYLTVHAAELWVGSLVAQEAIGTIGGHVLVGPTTTLEAILASGATSCTVAHNEMVKDDTAYLESSGKVEFIKIDGLSITGVDTTNDEFDVSGDWTSTFTNGVKFTVDGSTGNDGEWTVSSSSEAGGTTTIAVSEDVTDATVDGHILYTGAQGTGPYVYLVITRNLDGSGANEWYAGDALFNTGQVGDGFIDLYSVAAIGEGIVEDETGASWGTAYHGLSLRDGVAFIEVEGVSLADFAGSDGTITDYSIVLKDSSNFEATGYLGSAGSGLAYSSEMAANTGFENFTGTADDGNTDTFTSWSNSGTDANDLVEAITTSVHGGTYACKITRVDNFPQIYQTITVLPGALYRFYFWTRGDGSQASTFNVWDNSNSDYIIPVTSTGVTSTTWTYKEYFFTAPDSCVSINIVLKTPVVVCSVYFDDVSLVQVTESSSDGVHIVSTSGGNTRNWTSISGSFDYNDSSYTFEITGPKGGEGPTIVGNVRYSAADYIGWTEQWAIGNLRRIYGYTTDTYGVALGKYGNDHITIDDTNGIRFRDASNVAQGQLTSSTWTLGEIGAGKSNVQITSGAINLRTNTTKHISLEADGDVFIGEDISAPATTNIAIFTNAQTYNSESVLAGDVLLGDNTSGKANIYWDKLNGKFLFRGGTTEQAYIDTDGSIVAGGGDVKLNTSGITIAQDESNSENRIKWDAGGTYYPLEIWAYYTAGKTWSRVYARGVESTNYAQLSLQAVRQGGGTASIALYALDDDGDSSVFLTPGTVGSNYGTYNVGPMMIQDGLTVGALTKTYYPASGTIQIYKASGDPLLIYDIGGTDKFTLGVDDSDSDKFKINSGGSLADASDFEFDSSGNFTYVGNLKSEKNSGTEYDVYGFHPLTSPLTSGSWNNSAYSTTSKTQIDLSSVFSAPAGIKAALFYVAVRDSGAASNETWIILGPTSTANEGLAWAPLPVNDRWGLYGGVVVPCDSNGDVYYQIQASGSSTFDVSLQIWGYWI